MPATDACSAPPARRAPSLPPRRWPGTRSISCGGAQNASCVILHLKNLCAPGERRMGWGGRPVGPPFCSCPPPNSLVLAHVALMPLHLVGAHLAQCVARVLQNGRTLVNVWWRAAPAQAASRCRPPLGCSALQAQTPDEHLRGFSQLVARLKTRQVSLKSTFRSITYFFSLGASAEELIVCVRSSWLLISN